MRLWKSEGSVTSWGIRPATSTKLVSLALSTFVLLSIYPYINRALIPRSLNNFGVSSLLWIVLDSEDISQEANKVSEPQDRRKEG